jgi:hypothetical protein
MWPIAVVHSTVETRAMNALEYVRPLSFSSVWRLVRLLF